ncbi:protein cholesin isoform X3 [Bos taurus]|nr:uncharacterized protein C7orf50 homolog isoform X3 [Bos taurus]XP_024840677.1 uncharacterized protein C7orf50 homolog isoform X3 [Bos taurus]XP_024840678.1 uncharacterized protein C7orf50 homolog isoform X3 [Bos taurus]XP_024840679.1 uncharacterized protein C7orf50 homolog isoform X3 [Bos taurus]XP_059737310.1 uncharacterized protein C7orf50 homolog isoform X3 [Bos taurus]XP_059737311.1 uncharacterized protein C7orf50 homolog isoform X3 [Bos taurus]
MAKQKRKESEVAEKKSKKLKKVSAVEMPAACEALPGTGTAPAEGSASPSPEEQRVLERKLKKERKKEARRRLREAGVAAAPSPAVKRSGAALALEYLCSWAQKREDWRFQKTRQTWLLLHMYDRDQPRRGLRAPRQPRRPRIWTGCNPFLWSCRIHRDEHQSHPGYEGLHRWGRQGPPLRARDRVETSVEEF